MSINIDSRRGSIYLLCISRGKIKPGARIYIQKLKNIQQNITYFSLGNILEQNQWLSLHIRSKCLLLTSQSLFPYKLVYMTFLSHFPVVARCGTVGCVVHTTHCLLLCTHIPCFGPQICFRESGRKSRMFESKMIFS